MLKCSKKRDNSQITCTYTHTVCVLRNAEQEREKVSCQKKKTFKYTNPLERLNSSGQQKKKTWSFWIFFFIFNFFFIINVQNIEHSAYRDYRSVPLVRLTLKSINMIEFDWKKNQKIHFTTSGSIGDTEAGWKSDNKKKRKTQLF